MLLDTHQFPAERVPDLIPFTALYLPLPIDKAPPLVTWAKFAVPIWNVWENEREPLEIRSSSQKPLVPGDRLVAFSVSLCRGYTRATIIAFAICQMLTVEDAASFTESEKEGFTKWTSQILSCPFHLQGLWAVIGRRIQGLGWKPC